MIAFLTSSPCIDEMSEDIDLPCRLNEANGFVEKLSGYWKPDSRGLIISSNPVNFAMNNEMRDTFHKVFPNQGLTLSSMDICDFRNESVASDLVEESDVIILAGGHVPTQNVFFKRIKLKQLLQDYKGIVIGISAGTMNSAEIVYAQPEEEGESIDPAYERFLSGLGLTNVMISPHYQQVKDYELDGKRLFEDIVYPDSMGRKFYALVDGSYVLVDGNRTELYGEVYLIQDGSITQICNPEEMVVLSD